MIGVPLMYLDTIKKLSYLKQMCPPIVPEGKSLGTYLMASSDLKF